MLEPFDFFVFTWGRAGPGGLTAVGMPAGGCVAGICTWPPQCGQATCWPNDSDPTWKTPLQWGQLNCIAVMGKTIQSK